MIMMIGGEWYENTVLKELYLTRESVEQEVKKLETDIDYLCKRCCWLDRYYDVKEIKNIKKDTNIQIVINEHILIK